jgi:HemY protein
MIDAGAGQEVEEDIRLALGKDWNETLLVLYGCINAADPQQHLQSAEAWLAPHPDDAVLLRVLAKLAMRTGQTEKAREYVQKSLAVEPSVEACRLIGDFYQAQRDFATASDYYRKGLVLASNEVISQIEQHPNDQGETADVSADAMSFPA